MCKIFNMVTLLIVVTIGGCKKDSNSSGSSGTTPNPKSDFYFEYSIDGDKRTVTQEHLFSTFYQYSDHREFKMSTTTSDKDTVGLLLTIVADMNKPSSTPSGSEEYNSGLLDGCASLQDYPEKNYTSNSHDYTANPPIPITKDAIVVTSSVAQGDSARIITGTINVKVLGGYNPDNDPKIKDRMIVGKFRVLHLFKDGRF